MFVLASAGCSSASTPPTGSSSSSRSVEGRCRPTRPRGHVLELGAAVRSGSRAGCSTRPCGDDARLALVAATSSRSPSARRGARCSRGDVRRLRPRDDRALGPARRGPASSARCACASSSSASASRRSRTRARALQPADRRADRAARRGAAARAAGRGRRSAASSPSRATRCSSPTTRASTWRSSTTRRCG